MKCPFGSYTESYNQAAECTYCPVGTTTADQGSSNITDCNLALPGYYKTADYNATEWCVPARVHAASR